jgi:uncharacterized protein
MDQKIRNYLGITIIVVLAIFGIAALRYVDAYARSTGPTSYRAITVEGEGKVNAVPDVATFTFSVRSEGGKDLAATQNSNTAKMNKAIEYLKKSGVEAKDIRTTEYNVEPRYSNVVCPRDGGVCPQAEIIGYNVSQTAYVKARDISKAGALLSGVVSNGANSVSNLQVMVDDPLKAKAEAKAAAIKHAKAQAQMIAKEGGFRIGKLLSIDEGGAMPYYGEGMGGAMDATLKREVAQSAPAIEPGTQEIKVQVVLRYQIK